MSLALRLFFWEQGAWQVTGTGAGTLAALSGSAAGARGETGAAAGLVASLTGSASGARGEAGTIAGALAPVTGSAVGYRGEAGSESGTLAPLTASASGVRGVSGTIAGTLASVTGRASNFTVTGTGAGTLPRIGLVTGAVATQLLPISAMASFRPGATPVAQFMNLFYGLAGTPGEHALIEQLTALSAADPAIKAALASYRASIDDDLLRHDHVARIHAKLLQKIGAW